MKASSELFELSSADDPTVSLRAGSSSTNGDLSRAPDATTRFRLQAEFVPRRDDHYHVNDLLKYHDRQFVRNAHRGLLKREPDEVELTSYLERLRSGRFNKTDVLVSLRFSPEGRKNDVTIDGLRLRAMIRRLYRLPVLGYLIELAVGFSRLPFLIRHQRQIEAYLLAQLERTTAHVNAANQAIAASVSELAREQKRATHLQPQQVATLFEDHGAVREGGPAPGAAAPVANRLPLGYESSSFSAEAGFDLDEFYASFQAQFRGQSEDVKESLKIYLPLLKESGITSEILDIGCGRGEWLELLREAGMQARGVESNRVMIEVQRKRDLEIVDADALAYLHELPENSLHAITAFHFIEHLGLEELIELLHEVRRVLKPGGVVILETPNPKNLVVGACNFYSDPTHQRPLFPETLEFTLNHLGFVSTRVQYLHPVKGSPFEQADEGARTLHAWFFGPRDYAVLAYKP